MTDTPRTLVVVPTYNERENLPIALARLAMHTPHVDVLVVDDGSPDGTGELAEKLADAEQGERSIAVMHRTGKQGLGTAYIAGFGWALERDYDVVVEMDADGSHRAEDLPLLLAALDVKDADLVLGSRWVHGGKVLNWPVSRQILSRGANVYTRVALGLPLGDATGGFRAYRASLLRKLPLGEISSQGYCFQIDMAWRATKSGARVIEVPITFVERELGASKMSHGIIVEALISVTRWGIAERGRQLRGLVRGKRRTA